MISQIVSLLAVVVRLWLVSRFFAGWNPALVIFGCSELLQLVFTVTGLFNGKLDRSRTGWLVPLFYMLPVAFVTSSGGQPIALWLLAILSVWKVGVMLVLWSNISVGVPVFRSVTSRFPYSRIRHPLVTLTLLRAGCLVLAFPSSYNALIGGLVLASAIATALIEERHLLTFYDYRCYADRVRYRFLPGVA